MDIESIKGYLIDLDGVLYVGDQPIPGAAEAISHLRQQNTPCRFLTNTTTRSQKSLHAKTQKMGLGIEASQIISAPQAAIRFLRKRRIRKCFLVLSEDARQDFTEFENTEVDPECVVLGDIGTAWNYEILDKVFRLIMQGAIFIALHKGKWWRVEDGLKLDIGIFVSGLEYVTDQQAVIMGKPSADFFQMALSDLDLPKQNVAMIGDDIVSDVGAAQNFGIRGILVRTGKWNRDVVKKSSVKPDRIIDSIRDLVNLG